MTGMTSFSVHASQHCGCCYLQHCLKYLPTSVPPGSGCRRQGILLPGNQPPVLVVVGGAEGGGVPHCTWSGRQLLCLRSPLEPHVPAQIGRPCPLLEAGGLCEPAFEAKCLRPSHGPTYKTAPPLDWVAMSPHLQC